MMREILISGEKNRSYIVLEDGKPVELLRETGEDGSGQIYMGKVNRIAASLHAAFVDYGVHKDGFLPLEENSGSFTGEKLRSGMLIPVQIKKEAHGEKGAFLTRDLTLAGTYMVLMPMNRHVGVSSRVREEAERNALLQTGKELAGDRFGLVMRSAALNVEREPLEAEFDRLVLRWNELEEAIRTQVRVGKPVEQESILDDLLRDYAGRIDMIRTDDAALADMLKADHACELTDREKISSAVKNTRKAAMKRVVTLPHGGNLYIDPCEALTVFDVNTASDMRRKGGQAGYLETDLEACGEIARQIRLRNLSGIILIDMIDLKSETDRSLVLETLRNELSKDRIKTVVHGITDLGLVEITRRRTYRSVYEQWTVHCEKCGGSGRVLRTEEEEIS